MSDETKSPAELRAERFDRLRDRWNGLRDRVDLGYLYDRVEDTGTQIEALPDRVADLRRRGYRYSRDWEAQAEQMAAAWPTRRREVQRILQSQVRRLADDARRIEALCNRSTLSDGGLDRLARALDRLESQLSDAERDVRGAFDALENRFHHLQREFDRVELLLDSLDTASFDLHPDELGVAAGKARWTNHPDEPKGILFLTNGRLVFERREKKAKKRILFITTESERIQEMLWESPIGNVRELEAEDRRKFLRRKELLHLRFREYGRGLHGDVTLQLDGVTNEEWAGLIKRVQSGEIEADRYDVTREAPAEAAPPQKIPTKCPACGGRLPPLVKGMRELTCEYCGTVVRL